MIMTREEAVTIIDNLHLIGCGRNQHENDLRINVALDMAIEALSRSDDLISRADAIEAWDKLSKRGRTEFDQVLMTLPSADAVSREECDECKTDKEGVLLQQLAELQGDYETMKNAYEDALADAEWIPITTSEPTTSNHVLVTYNWGDDDYDDYEVSELDYWVTKCAAEEGNKQCQMFIDHVIAWSFMPQPYKEI